MPQIDFNWWYSILVEIFLFFVSYYIIIVHCFLIFFFIKLLFTFIFKLSNNFYHFYILIINKLFTTSGLLTQLTNYFLKFAGRLRQLIVVICLEQINLYMSFCFGYYFGHINYIQTIRGYIRYHKTAFQFKRYYKRKHLEVLFIEDLLFDFPGVQLGQYYFSLKFSRQNELLTDYILGAAIYYIANYLSDEFHGDRIEMDFFLNSYFSELQFKFEDIEFKSVNEQNLYMEQFQYEFLFRRSTKLSMFYLNELVICNNFMLPFKYIK